MTLREKPEAGWNPRFVLWCESRGFQPDSFDRAEGEDMKLVEHGDGKQYPWTLVFSDWIKAQWKEWAHSIGFKDSNFWQAHRLAQAAGHGPAEFDAWLRLKVGGA